MINVTNKKYKDTVLFIYGMFFSGSELEFWENILENESIL